MALNEKIEIVLGDDKMFGIGILDGVITKESFKEGKKSISVSLVSPLKTPYYLKESDQKQELEIQRYKQDARKRALEVSERTISQSQGGAISDSILKEADKYYNWLISIPDSN